MAGQRQVLHDLRAPRLAQQRAQGHSGAQLATGSWGALLLAFWLVQKRSFFMLRNGSSLPDSCYWLKYAARTAAAYLTAAIGQDVLWWRQLAQLSVNFGGKLRTIGQDCLQLAIGR